MIYKSVSNVTANAVAAVIINCCSHFFYCACEGTSVCVWLLESTLNAVRPKAAAAVCLPLRGGVCRRSALPKLHFLPSPTDPSQISAAFLCYASPRHTCTCAASANQIGGVIKKGTCLLDYQESGFIDS